jgi:hypothetical protein
MIIFFSFHVLYIIVFFDYNCLNSFIYSYLYFVSKKIQLAYSKLTDFTSTSIFLIDLIKNYLLRIFNLLSLIKKLISLYIIFFKNNINLLL